jgi:hypothetical protein
MRCSLNSFQFDVNCKKREILSIYERIFVHKSHVLSLSLLLVWIFPSVSEPLNLLFFLYADVSAMLGWVVSQLY